MMMKNDNDLSEDEQAFWDTLSKKLPPPYALIEERTRELIQEKIEHLESMEPDGNDYNYVRKNKEMLEYFRKQLSTYRIIRPEEIVEREKTDTLNDMTNFLKSFPKDE